MVSLVHSNTGDHFFNGIDQAENPTKIILAAIDMPFNERAGGKVNAYGAAQNTHIPTLDAIGARRHHVKGDGSCWSRALWQCTFSQILDNNREFYNFIDKVADPQGGFKNNPLQRETIHILHKLKNKTPSQRLDYLNNRAVDETLIFFMRNVAADFMAQKGWGTAAERADIRVNIHKYGAREVMSFANHFKLELHRIARKDVIGGAGQWEYYYKGKNETTERRTAVKDVDLLMNNCMFGANAAHYEFLSFDHSALVSSSSTDLAQKKKTFKDTADDCCEQLSDIITKEHEAQIAADRKLALKLQAKDRSRHRASQNLHKDQIRLRIPKGSPKLQIARDAALASKLHTRLNTTPRSIVSPRPASPVASHTSTKTRTQEPLLAQEKSKGFFAKAGALFQKILKSIGSFFSSIHSYFSSKTKEVEDKTPQIPISKANLSPPHITKRNMALQRERTIRIEAARRRKRLARLRSRNQTPQPTKITNRITTPPALPVRPPLAERASLIKAGNQSGCSGTVRSPVVDEYVMIQLSDKVAGVTFERENITTVAGGTCSAMSLNFLRKYFDGRKVTRVSPGGSPALKAIQTIADREISASSQDFRETQAAFNQIRLTDSGQRLSLASKTKKIQALSGFYGMKVEDSSDEFNVDSVDQRVFQASVQGLQNGAYILRQLKEEDNLKGETCGHSMAIVKEGSKLFFYDPNFGIRQYSDATGADLLDRLKGVNRSHNVNKARFYKLQLAA